jgi:hypothetical protein
MEKTKLPNGFKWKTWSDKCDLEALADQTEVSDELFFDDDRDKAWHPRVGVSDRFNERYRKWMDEAGTPIKRQPSVGFKDLNLYKLFTLVFLDGGHEEVTKKALWKHTYARLTGVTVERAPPSADKVMKSAYEKYLQAFTDSDVAEEFKLIAEDTKVMKTPQVVPAGHVGSPEITDPPPVYTQAEEEEKGGKVFPPPWRPAEPRPGTVIKEEAETAAAAAKTTDPKSKSHKARARPKPKPKTDGVNGRGDETASPSVGNAAVAGGGPAGAAPGIANAAWPGALTASPAFVNPAAALLAQAAENADPARTTEFVYAAGDAARCMYRDGKRYLVTVEDREMREVARLDGDAATSMTGKNVAHYFVHFDKWHKKFDSWVPFFRVFGPNEGGSKRRRGKPKVTAPAAVASAVQTGPAASAAAGPVSAAVAALVAASAASPLAAKSRVSGGGGGAAAAAAAGGGDAASALAAAASFAFRMDGAAAGNNVDTDDEDAQEALDRMEMGDGEGGAMTDEELAKMLAGHEMAHAGRRRETRRSFNANLSSIKPTPPATTAARTAKGGKKPAAPKFGAGESAGAPTDAEIDMMVENSVGIRRNKRTYDREGAGALSPVAAPKSQPHTLCYSTTFGTGYCQHRGNKRCYTPSCRANARFWLENNVSNNGEVDPDAVARQAEHHEKLRETLTSIQEKSLEERIDFLRQRYSRHMKAVKVIRQRERADAKAAGQ